MWYFVIAAELPKTQSRNLMMLWSIRLNDLCPVGPAPATCFKKIRRRKEKKPQKSSFFLGFLKEHRAAFQKITNNTQLPFCTINCRLLGYCIFFLAPGKPLLRLLSSVFSDWTLFRATTPFYPMQVTHWTTGFHIHLTTFNYLIHIIDRAKEVSLTISKVIYMYNWSNLLRNLYKVSIKINVYYSSNVCIISTALFFYLSRTAGISNSKNCVFDGQVKLY